MQLAGQVEAETLRGFLDAYRHLGRHASHAVLVAAQGALRGFCEGGETAELSVRQAADVLWGAKFFAHGLSVSNAAKRCNQGKTPC
jgi:enoyl-CoA hydratase/carnithine racemase